MILSYSSQCDQRFGLSTFLSASRYVPAVIYQLGSQRAVLLLTRLSSGSFRPLWQRADFFFANSSGSIPSHWPPGNSLQEVCLMLKNVNRVDWREKKNLTRIVEETHCALCFARKPSIAMKLCK